MRSHCDVIIIGGGIMGASTAYHLAHRGCKNVVVLESSEMFGMGSTGLNAGGVRHQFSTPVNIELSKLSFSMMERFPDEMGQAIGLRHCGYLFLLDAEADLDRFRKNVALQNSLGVPSCVVSVDEIRALAPEVELDGIIGGTWCPRDGLVDPNGLLAGYVSGARRLGVELHSETAATRIEALPGNITRVSTAHGAVEAPTVLIAAGAWSANIGRMFGLSIPIQPIRRQIAVTAPVPGLRAEFPFVIDFAKALYFHREGDALLTGMSNRDEVPGFDTRIDEAWRARHLEAAVERLPLLGDTELAAEWAGLYEVTPDDQPILGKVPQRDGVLICAGFSGHGLMHGPAAGLLMAEEILDGRAHTIDIDPLRWSRFDRASSGGEYNVV